MKKLLLILVLITSINFSCTNNFINHSKFTGKWDTQTQKGNFSFSSDGKFIQISFSSSGRAFKENGTYRLEKNILYITYNDGTDYKYTILSMDNGSLILRKEDSEIEEKWIRIR